MKNSFLTRLLSLCIVIILFTNTINHVKALTVPSSQTNCGEWSIDSAGQNDDQRIGIKLLRQAEGNECYGMFTLENQTGTILGGGYSLSLKAISNNATVQYLPNGDDILIPGLNIEIKTIPNDPYKQANINLQGEVTLGSFLAVDLSFFLLKSVIDAAPLPTGCLISYDQIFLITLRTAPILENTARLAFEGKFLESKEELSRVIDVFYEKVGDVARDIGIGCFADFIKSIIKKPIVIAKIVLSYITWVPVVIFDYFKYQGFLTSVKLSYIPPISSTISPMPSVSATTITIPLPPTASSNSSTAMLFDVSGSMSEDDATGITKIDAARNSGARILDIIAAENAVSQGAEVGILSFSNGAWVNAFISSDVASARSALNGLYPLAGTGMPDGLRLAIDQFSGIQNAKPIIILLSDGLPNVPLGSGGTFGDEDLARQQSLDLASEAGSKGICIYTVGFGIPYTVGTISGQASIDEDFLKQVAANSGCGAYYNAQNATQLANVYVSLRHQSTGNILLNQTGNISQGQTVDIGNVQVPDNQSMILFTLNWPGSQLDAILTDPTGMLVDSNYPNASFSLADTLASIIIQNPQPGEWKVAAKGVDVPEGITTYNAVLSARPNPNPPTALPTAPQVAPQATMPNAPGFPVVILLLVVAGGGIAIYVMMQTRVKSRSKAPVGAISAQLVGISGELAGQALPLRDGLLAGRGSGSALKLKDRAVSRQHVVFRFASGQWFIQDMNSQTGTFVNDARVQAISLKNGDRIRIGSSVFEFRTIG